MNTKTWIIFIAATIAILGGLIYISKQNTLDVSGVDKFKVITTQEEADQVQSGIPDQIKGNKTNAKITIIEYGDYSCPGCNTLNTSINNVMKDYKNDVAIVFRHFPITSIHPNSKMAAAYAEAAGFQGKFWEMHDKLFSTRTEWSSVSVDKRTELFNGYASSLGLDVERIKQDITNASVTKKLNFDQAIGRASKVSATPTVFLNGRLLNSDEFSTEEQFRNTIKTAVESAK